MRFPKYIFTTESAECCANLSCFQLDNNRKSTCASLHKSMGSSHLNISTRTSSVRTVSDTLAESNLEFEGFQEEGLSPYLGSKWHQCRVLERHVTYYES